MSSKSATLIHFSGSDLDTWGSAGSPIEIERPEVRRVFGSQPNADLSKPSAESARSKRTTPQQAVEAHKRLSKKLEKHGDRRLRRAVSKTLSALGPQTVETLLWPHTGPVRAVPSDPAKRALLADLTGGRSFTTEEAQALHTATLLRGFERRRQLLEGALRTADVARLLGVTRQTPHDRVNTRNLLAMRDGGHLWFPAWQFDPTGPNGVISDLPRILAALCVSDFAKASWLTLPNRALGGRTPIRALQDGDAEHVLTEAQVVGAM